MRVCVVFTRVLFLSSTFPIASATASVSITPPARFYEARGVSGKCGLPPEKVVDVMAIWGDAIDNIPGVPGIGEKGAKGLIQQFGSLEGVYENLEQVGKPALRKKLEEHREKAFLSRELAKIKCDLDLN